MPAAPVLVIPTVFSLVCFSFVILPNCSPAFKMLVSFSYCSKLERRKSIIICPIMAEFNLILFSADLRTCEWFFRVFIIKLKFRCFLLAGRSYLELCWMKNIRADNFLYTLQGRSSYPFSHSVKLLTRSVISELSSVILPPLVFSG